MGAVLRIIFAAKALIAIGVLAIVLDMAVEPLVGEVTPRTEGTVWHTVIGHVDSAVIVFVPMLLFAIVLYLIWGGAEEERREEIQRVRPP